MDLITGRIVRHMTTYNSRATIDHVHDNIYMSTATGDLLHTFVAVDLAPYGGANIVFEKLQTDKWASPIDGYFTKLQITTEGEHRWNRSGKMEWVKLEQDELSMISADVPRYVILSGDIVTGRRAMMLASVDQETAAHIYVTPIARANPDLSDFGVLFGDKSAKYTFKSQIVMDNATRVQFDKMVAIDNERMTQLKERRDVHKVELRVLDNTFATDFAAINVAFDTALYDIRDKG